MKKIILNELFGILVLGVLLIPQVAHTIYVFEANSQYDHPWFSYCYAVGVDLAILIFTVKGWIKTAVVYCIGTLAHNLVYQFYPESVWSAVLICVMLSGTIFSFSHLFYAKTTSEEKDDPSLQKIISKELLVIREAKKMGVHFEPQPFICPQCQQPFSMVRQLNAHIAEHKQKNTWTPEQYGNWQSGNRKRLKKVLGYRRGNNVKIISNGIP
jgi:hypothetical protein